MSINSRGSDRSAIRLGLILLLAEIAAEIAAELAAPKHLPKGRSSLMLASPGVDDRLVMPEMAAPIIHGK